MDDLRFDRLTRRFVVTGLGGGSLTVHLGLVGALSRKKPSKRKRCRKKKRDFCAGRCCRKGHRCETNACVQSCANPFACPDNGGGAGCGDGCFCSTSISGTTACVVSNPGSCGNLEACSATDPCPRGQICALCDCLNPPPIFRCQRPCPP